MFACPGKPDWTPESLSKKSPELTCNLPSSDNSSRKTNFSGSCIHSSLGEQMIFQLTQNWHDFDSHLAQTPFDLISHGWLVTTALNDVPVNLTHWNVSQNDRSLSITYQAGCLDQNCSVSPCLPVRLQVALLGLFTQSFSDAKAGSMNPSCGPAIDPHDELQGRCKTMSALFLNDCHPLHKPPLAQTAQLAELVGDRVENSSVFRARTTFHNLFDNCPSLCP